MTGTSGLPSVPGGSIRGILGSVTAWPERLPGRLRRKLVSFDQKIAKFPQRRWA
jgi:hypothetical protein